MYEYCCGAGVLCSCACAAAAAASSCAFLSSSALRVRVDGGVHLVHGVGDGLLVALVDEARSRGARIFVLHLAFGGGIQSFALFDGMGQP